jgi:hypothetical protein
MTSPSERVRRLVELESQIAYRTPPAPGESEFSYQPGRLPVLLSAPHGAAHIRNGEGKEEDEYTAGLALLLAETTGAHALYAHHQSPVDPNWDAGVPYKLALREAISAFRLACVIDLHGANPHRDFGLAVGTLNGHSLSSLREPALAALRAHGFHPGAAGLHRLDLDRRFTAIGKPQQETITRYCWEGLGIPAVQIEINGQLRVPPRRVWHGHAAAHPGLAWVERAIDALTELVHQIAKNVSSQIPQKQTG